PLRLGRLPRAIREERAVPALLLSGPDGAAPLGRGGDGPWGPETERVPRDDTDDRAFRSRKGWPAVHGRGLPDHRPRAGRRFGDLVGRAGRYQGREPPEQPVGWPAAV